MPRRPQKKRRLSTTSSATSATDSTCTVHSPLDSDIIEAVLQSENLSCVSCNRSLVVSAYPDSTPNALLICPRCRATSCSICSRICTACPPSMPPTPLLSYSPSLPGTPISPAQLNTLPSVGDVEDTPRPRHAVAHSHPQAQTQAVVSPSRPRQRSEPSKRKKKKTEDDEEGNTPIGADDNAVTKSTGGNTPGCGRTLCKNCCIENAQSDATTCYDCYGLPSPRPHAGGTYSSTTNSSMTSLIL